MNTSTYAERVQDMGPLEAPFSLKNWRRGIFRSLLYRQKLWSYRWSHGWKLGAMPWAIPVIDALTYVLVFLLHGVAVQLTSGMGWASALATSYVIYAAMFVTIALFNWVTITQVFGVRPTPA